jgi:hypothetical protein
MTRVIPTARRMNPTNTTPIVARNFSQSTVRDVVVSVFSMRISSMEVAIGVGVAFGVAIGAGIGVGVFWAFISFLYYVRVRK